MTCLAVQDGLAITGGFLISNNEDLVQKVGEAWSQITCFFFGSTNVPLQAGVHEAPIPIVGHSMPSKSKRDRPTAQDSLHDAARTGIHSGIFSNSGHLCMSSDYSWSICALVEGGLKPGRACNYRARIVWPSGKDGDPGGGGGGLHQGGLFHGTTAGRSQHGCSCLVTRS